MACSTDCGCEVGPAAQCNELATALRCDVELAMRLALKRHNPDVTKLDGMARDTASWLKSLMTLHDHLRAAEGAYWCHVAIDPCDVEPWRVDCQTFLNASRRRCDCYCHNG